MRALICTFGFDNGKIIEATKLIGNDELYLVTGYDNDMRDAYSEIVELRRRLNAPMETIRTNIFDLIQSFETIRCLMRQLKNEGKEVKLNLSGGLPLLTDAALLAAMNEGVETYFVNGALYKLPVLRGVTIEEKLTEAQKDLIIRINECGKVSELRTVKGRYDVMDVLLELKGLNLISVYLWNGKQNVKLTAQGEETYKWLQRARDR